MAANTAAAENYKVAAMAPPTKAMGRYSATPIGCYARD